MVIASRKQRRLRRSSPTRSASETGRRALGVACHVGRWADCDALADAAYAEFGRVDVLVNNAGMSPLYPSLAEVSEELFDKVLGGEPEGAVPALGADRHAHGRRRGRLDHQREQHRRRGALAERGALRGREGRAQQPHGRARARVRARRSASTASWPGPFLTDISKAWEPEAFESAAEAASRCGRGGEADEVVGAALYLASDASSFTTGAVIKIDGGLASAPA